MPIKDITGNKYGMLEVIEISYNNKTKVYWRCKCDCGNEKIARGDKLKDGSTWNCGCRKIKRKKTSSNKNVDSKYTTIESYKTPEKKDTLSPCALQKNPQSINEKLLSLSLIEDDSVDTYTLIAYILVTSNEDHHFKYRALGSIKFHNNIILISPKGLLNKPWSEDLTTLIRAQLLGI